MIDQCVSIRQDRVDNKYLNKEKAYHLWAGIKEFGRDGKKWSKDKNSPQAQPIMNRSMAWDLDFMHSQTTIASTAMSSDQEEEQGNEGNSSVNLL
jgi:hypothetical protein